MAEDYSYLGSGIILIREWNSGLPFEEIGNVSAFSTAAQTNTIELADNQNPGGGMANSVDRVTGWNLNYTFHDFSPANFARATRGKASDIAAGTVADELVRVSVGAYAPLARIATEITSVKPVTGTATYEAGKDYRLERGMLFIPVGTSIPAGDPDGSPNVKARTRTLLSVTSKPPLPARSSTKFSSTAPTKRAVARACGWCATRCLAASSKAWASSVTSLARASCRASC